MSAQIVTPDSTTAPVTFQFFGTVTLYLETSGILHAVHEDACLKCGETEAWIAEYTPAIGTAESPKGGAYGARPGYITL